MAAAEQKARDRKSDKGSDRQTLRIKQKKDSKVREGEGRKRQSDRAKKI